MSLKECLRQFPLVQWEWTPVAGKRNTLRVGIAKVIGEVVVLVDSDTIWTEGTLEELLKPFADPQDRRGHHSPTDPRSRGATSCPDGPIGWSRAGPSIPCRLRASWVKWAASRAARSPFGGTCSKRSCRTSDPGILRHVLEVSDDRTLTNLTLKRGYRTSSSRPASSTPIVRPS